MRDIAEKPIFSAALLQIGALSMRNPGGKFFFCFIVSILLAVLSFVSPAVAQRQLLEDFEDNLDQWTVINGDIALSTGQAQQGSSAVRMRGISDDDNISTLEFNGLDENFGSYEIWFYCTGSSSSADFLIQYIDDNNYFRVSCRPIGTNNSGIVMSQATPRGVNILASAPATFHLNQWYQLRIDRYCDGHIHIDIDGSRILTLDIFRDYERGKVQLQSRSSETYFDGLSFLPFQPPPLLARIDTTCAGVPVRIGGKLRYTPGIYQEVTYIIEANCVSEQEVALHVIDVDTFRESHTLCLGETLELYDQKFMLPGNYQVATPVIEGCGPLTEITIDQHPWTAPMDSFAFCPIPGNVISPGIYSSYLWENGNTSSQLRPDLPGNYRVVLTDQFACTFDLDILVEDNCPITTWVPNAFSPNGDGTNDFLTSAHNKSIGSFRMSIFDRWGNHIYSTEDQQGWDGKVNAQDAPVGVYLYLLKINEETYSGEFTLIR